MKDASKPSGKVALVDQRPISIPMISSTTSSSSGGGGAGGAPSSVVVQAVAEAVKEAVREAVRVGAIAGVGSAQVELVTVKSSISRNQSVEGRIGLVSRGTQTTGGESEVEGNNNGGGPPPPVLGTPEDLQEKRRLIRKQLAVLLHAVLCKVRDELIGNTGENARECPTAHCGLMKNVLGHLRTCDARSDCPHPHCLSSRQILTHWKACVQADCPVCSSLRRVVPAYLEGIVRNPRWRGEIMNRFNWLITFIGPISMRTTHSLFQLAPPPQVQAQRQAELEDEETRSHTNDAEE